MIRPGLDTTTVATCAIWLIGGSAGTGKSRVAYPLAASLGIPLIEIDDLVEALMAMTTPSEQPVLHYWRTHPEAQALAPASVVELQVAVGRALGPAIEALVANHLNTNAPVVIEGDYLLPAFAALPSFGAEPSAGRVRAVFLVESDERQLLATFTKREPGAPAQTGRATVSRIYGEWLAREATDRGLAVVAARPWNTVLERVRLAAANSGMDPRT